MFSKNRQKDFIWITLSFLLVFYLSGNLIFSSSYYIMSVILSELDRYFEKGKGVPEQ